MNRAFNSALNRRKKRKSGSGVSSDDKTWKFETAMSFLKVVKTQRTTTCNLDQDNDSEDEPSGDEDANIIEKAADDAGIFQTADDDYQSSSQQQQQQPNKLSSTQGKPKSKSGKRKVAADSNDDDARNCLYRAVQQRMEDTSKKSPRLKFFESIMPRVDAMSEDGFLEFQIGVLNLLKRSRNEAPNPVRQTTHRPYSAPPSWSVASTTIPPFQMYPTTGAQEQALNPSTSQAYQISEFTEI